MGIFRQLHKSAFWSQLLLGMVAILSLPAAEAVPNTAQSNAIQQSYHLSELVATQQAESEQAHFLAQHQTIQQAQQRVKICKMFAKIYPLYAVAPPPIRAGPNF